MFIWAVEGAGGASHMRSFEILVEVGSEALKGGYCFPIVFCMLTGFEVEERRRIDEMEEWTVPLGCLGQYCLNVSFDRAGTAREFTRISIDSAEIQPDLKSLSSSPVSLLYISWAKAEGQYDGRSYNERHIDSNPPRREHNTHRQIGRVQEQKSIQEATKQASSCKRGLVRKTAMISHSGHRLKNISNPHRRCRQGQVWYA